MIKISIKKVISELKVYCDTSDEEVCKTVITHYNYMGEGVKINWKASH